jgi:hypothetical protein
MPVQQLISGFLNWSVNFQQILSGALPGNIQPINYPLSANLQFVNAVATALGVDQVTIGQLQNFSTTQTLNLNSGLKDLNGNAFSIARCRFAIFQNLDPAATHLVEIYADATHGWTVLPPVANFQTIPANGGTYMIVDPASIGTNGYVVTSTNCVVDINPNSNTITAVNYLIAGSSS